MTSKSLEALELLELILNNHSIMLEVDDNRMEYINVIKQDLERLKVLEKIIEKAEEVEQENLLLKIDNDQLNHIAEERLKKIEKLEKAIEIALKYDVSLESVKRLNYVDYVELCIMFNETYPTQQEYELLKEVLSNEMV